MKKKWFALWGVIFTFSIISYFLIDRPLILAEGQNRQTAVSESNSALKQTLETPQEQNRATTGNNVISPAIIDLSLGASSASGKYGTGTSNEGIMSMTFTFTPVLTLTLATNPIVLITLPKEISDQLTTAQKQTDFLNALGGTVSRPSLLLGSTSAGIQTKDNFTLGYSAALGAIYVTYPTFTTLSALSKWEVALTLNVGTLYKKGITIPPAYNGTNYSFQGDFTDSGTALSVITGFRKTGTIETKTADLGTIVPQISVPAITTKPVHLSNTIAGNIQQTQNTNYTYTIQLTVKRKDGTTTPVVISGIPVDASGNFTSTLSSPLEYGDTVSAVVIATSKTVPGEYIQSLSSSEVNVSWAVVPVTAATIAAGTTQITGVSTQTATGLYQVQAQINNGNTYTTPLNANGSFTFTGLPTFQGGESVKLTVQGLSTRTSNLILTQSTDYTSTVAYLSPQINITHKIERLNSLGVWEIASTATIGQTVRYTLTTTLTNQPASWLNQTIRSNIPTGLNNVTVATLNKVSSAGITTPALSPTQKLTDSGTNTQYWSYQNLLTADNFTQPNTSFVLQYTGVVGSNMVGQTMTFSNVLGGVNGGGTAIPSQNGSAAITIQDGSLQFISAPSTISFNKIAVPTSRRDYASTGVTGSLTIADGRAVKTPWYLYVKEEQPLSSTTSSKSISQAFVYKRAGINIPITSSATQVYAYTATNSNNYTISWDQQNGIFLQLSPNANITTTESYTGRLNWILADTPI